MIRTALAALPRFALFLLAILPVLTGWAVLSAMWQGGTGVFSDPADILRRQSYPVAIVGHIIGGSAMLILGFTQFSTALRRRFPRLHVWLGRGLVVAGMGFALFGLAMNASPQAQADSALYNTSQNVMAVAYLCILGLGIRAIRQGRVADHRAWMMRGYAITLGVATQTLLLLPVFVMFGPPMGLLSDLVVILAWAFNLAVAEGIIRGWRLPRRHARPAAAPHTRTNT